MNWNYYTVMVTLIPTGKIDLATTEHITAVLATYKVNALDDHMAGTLACAWAEDEHKGYQAIMYERTEIE